MKVEDILKKKILYPDKDLEYSAVPIMACNYWDCNFCKARIVAKNRSGVIQRMKAHCRKEHSGKW